VKKYPPIPRGDIPLHGPYIAPHTPEEKARLARIVARVGLIVLAPIGWVFPRVPASIKAWRQGFQVG
jgi:hypothetical protein